MRKPVVLHHSGNISGTLAEFFAAHGATVLPLEGFDGLTTLTHVLVSGDQDFSDLADLYGTVESDVRLVALGPVRDLTSFLANNGRMVIDPRWIEEKLGRVQLEKFFLGAASVALDENFPTVKAGGAFKVVNHLRTGADADRLSAFVHAHGDDVVGVRTFFDHALYYLTYLQQAGVAMAPFEVDYGHTGAETVLQIHLPVNGFVAEHMVESFGDTAAREGHAWLLGVCARACDFMEVQYIEQASRLVISGTWRKSGARFSGLALNHVNTTAQIRAALENAVWEENNSAAAPAEKPLPGALGEVALPPPPAEGKLQADPVAAKTLVAFLVDTWKQTHPEQTVASMDVQELTEILSGHPDVELASQLVDADVAYLLDTVQNPAVADAYSDELGRARAAMASDEASQKILGDKFAEEVAQKVLGGLTEEEISKLVKGGTPEEDDVSQLVKGGMSEEEARNVVKSGREKVEEALVRLRGDKPGDKGAWKVRSMPGGNVQQQFQGHMRSALTKRFGDLDPEQALAQLDAEDRARLTEAAMKAAVADVNALAVPSQLSHVLAEQFGRSTEDMDLVVKSSQAETKKAETDLVVKSLMEAKETPPPVSGDAGTAMLREKIKQLEDENKKNRGQLEATRAELRATRDSQKVVEKGAEAVGRAVQAMQTEALTSVDEKMAMIKAAGEGPEAAAKLRAIMEREQKLIQLAKDAETEVRKAKLESTQKEAFFVQEVEKNQRALKSRDLVLDKIKESMNLMAQKKDKQIADLAAKLKAASDMQVQSQTLFQQMKVMEQEKTAITRMAEMYKAKLASTAANLDKAMALASGNKKDEDSRRMLMEKQRLEVALQTGERDMEKLRSKMDVSTNELSRLRADANSNADKMRGLIDQVKSLSAAAASSGQKEDQTAKLKLAENDLAGMTHKFSKSEQHVKELEAKITEMASQIAKGTGKEGDAGMKKQVQTLEATVKKLTGDIAAANGLVTEAKKEVNKARSEKTALQNQIDKMKKDAAKTDKKVA